MTARGLYTLIFGLVLMVTALSVSSPGAFLLGAAALIAFFLSLVCVVFAFFTCRIAQDVQGGHAERGSACLYSVRVRVFSPLPVAPLQLRVCLPSGAQQEYILPLRLFGETASDNRFPCAHVGVFPVGVTAITVSDCFGLFALRHAVRDPLLSVTVLPKAMDTDEPAFSPGQGEHTIALRAQSDRTTPEDTRLWQEGDDLKRVHWKLSMRRQELMVHTYETPQRPDALVLLDCGAPALPGGEAASGTQRAALIDALTESAAGHVRALLESGRPVRLPLHALRTGEISGQSIDRLDAMRDALAQEPFADAADFVHMLALASRRLGRTGSAVIVSTRLTPAIADAVIALGLSGPRMRFVLVHAGAPSDTQEQLLHLLEASGMQARRVAA